MAENVAKANAPKREPLRVNLLTFTCKARVKHLKTKVTLELDRQTAIEKALGSAQAGDVLIIAGKGHETYQIFKDQTLHFDDREVARHWLERNP